MNLKNWFSSRFWSLKLKKLSLDEKSHSRSRRLWWEELVRMVMMIVMMVRRISIFLVDHVDHILSGWRIMPEDDSLNLKMNKDILNQVLERIKWDSKVSCICHTYCVFIFLYVFSSSSMCFHDSMDLCHPQGHAILWTDCSWQDHCKASITMFCPLWKTLKFSVYILLLLL